MKRVMLLTRQSARFGRVKAARKAKWQRGASEAAVRRAKERTAERVRQQEARNRAMASASRRSQSSMGSASRR